MKKILLALAIGTASLVGLSSCTKEYVTQYTPGISYYKTVASNQWVEAEEGENYYMVELDLPELKDYIYDDGDVGVAIQFEADKGLFYNLPASGVSRDNDKSAGRNIHEFNAAYSIGKIYLKAFDMTNRDRSPEDIRVKIVLTEAEIGN